LWVFYVTIAFAAVYCVLYPAWPSLSGYTRGVLNYSSRDRHRAQMQEIAQARAIWAEKIAVTPLQDIIQSPELLRIASAGGRTLFANNCAPCHGTAATGRPGGYPSLIDDDWIWGGTLDEIHATITHGVRNDTADARFSQMPAFGADGILTPEQVSAVANHVLSLSGAAEPDAKGAEVFAENCIACHGELGTGVTEVGGPNLADQIWLHGGSKEAVVSQIVRPRQGVMPPWNTRLSETEIKQLTVYVHTLGGGL
jgi:cytochrome c oxidase cbb3-type subunit 3